MSTATRTLQFYGASDDLFEIEGTIPGEPDEIDCWLGNKGVNAAVEIRDENGHGLRVTAMYAAFEAVWNIGVEPLDEDVPIPDWPMKISLSDRGYSTLLAMEVPDTVVVTQKLPEKE
jgi:hypothetical protein